MNTIHCHIMSIPMGVICGIETYAEDEFLYITAGIIKYNNFYYKIKGKIKK